jgi:ketosteroid isomerase-like protein
MSQENVETVRAAFEASRSFLSAFGEDVEMHAPNWGLDPGVFRGKEAIRTWLRNWIGTWDDYEAEAYEYLDAGPCVVVEQIQRGRNKRTGLPLNARHWNVFTLANGKIVSWRMYQTRDEALEAAGLRE